MSITYKGWQFSEPTIYALADESGYTVFNLDIFRMGRNFTFVQHLWIPGKFPTRATALTAVRSFAKLLIDNL